MIFFEEPHWRPPGDARSGDLPRLELRTTAEGVEVATPILPLGLDEAAKDAAQRALLDGLLEGRKPDILWFYTPMAFDFAGHLEAGAVVYDCMDELSAFRGASPRLQLLERRLMKRADLVFTGGRSLYEAKRGLHPSVHQFTSGVDVSHFGKARAMTGSAEPADQAPIARPRIGWFGVVDERMDLTLVDEVAARRPDWSLIMIGPVVKIDDASLPRRSNIHWLGGKGMPVLPSYLAGWDCGFMPFALNEHTRYISPTKTPEYLAAGVPVVCTPITDVVRDWGDEGYVSIVKDTNEAVAAIGAAMAGPRDAWWPAADARLGKCSWDSIWSAMERLIRRVAGEAAGASSVPTPLSNTAVAGSKNV